MKVTMLLAEAATWPAISTSSAGGGNITGPRVWHDQACADLEAWLDQAPVPWEGITAKRSGGA